MTAADGANIDHRLLEYGSEAEFVAGVVPFLRDGLEVGEPGLVVAPAGKIATLRRALGSEVGERIRFADSDSWGSGNVAARVLAVEVTIRKLLATAVRCRYVGEFTWQGDTQRREWRRHEAAANLLRPASQVGTLCAVDIRTNPPDFLDDLRRTHPIIAPDRPNAGFVEPRTYLAQLDLAAYQPAPGHADTITAVDDADLRRMRRRVSAEARAAGLGAYRTQCLELAATEVVANAVHHAGTPATIKTWTSGSRFLCEVGDKGPGIGDPLASYRPPEPAGGKCGLWLARTFSDEVWILSSAAGTLVQMSFLRS